MKEEMVSIIVPCYNQAEFLDECLTSVINQDYQNWECIIVNDGSNDDTAQTAQIWLSRDKRFNKKLYIAQSASTFRMCVSKRLKRKA